MTIEIEFAKAESILDAIDEVIYVSDTENYEILYLSRAGRDIWGDILGEKCFKSLQGFESPCEFCTNDIILGEYFGRTYVWEFQNEVNKCWYRCLDRAIDWPDGRKVRFEIAIDITKQKEIEEILRRKSEEILELSTPVIKIWEGVVVAPLIGTFDSERAMIFTERFLTKISETESHTALLDITGVPTVDTQTAQYLMETVSAASLLGSSVVLTGVSPNIAQTLVQLGIDLSGIEIKANLASGLELALSTVGSEVIKNHQNGEDD